MYGLWMNHEYYKCSLQSRKAMLHEIMPVFSLKQIVQFYFSIAVLIPGLILTSLSLDGKVPWQFGYWAKIKYQKRFVDRKAPTGCRSSESQSWQESLGRIFFFLLQWDDGTERTNAWMSSLPQEFVGIEDNAESQITFLGSVFWRQTASKSVIFPCPSQCR